MPPRDSVSALRKPETSSASLGRAGGGGSGNSSMAKPGPTGLGEKHEARSGSRSPTIESRLVKFKPRAAAVDPQRLN
jgi:hypothetical protein